MNLRGQKICDNCFRAIKGEPCPECGFKRSKYKPEFGTLPVGTVLQKRYAVGQVLGKGGFGVTYKAYDTAVGKIVAIKEYYPNGLVHRDSGTTGVTVTDAKHTENFQTGANKFYEEAKTVSKFNGNPNIVGVYEFFYENNTVYYVMEYLEGQDLKQFLKKNGGKLPQEKALYVADVMTDALLITHSMNVLHRDLSPDNIFVLNSGEIKLIDFGAARSVFAEQSKSLSVILKQGFAPLEQYQRRGKQGPWTDIYALGATLFYALTESVMDDATERLESAEIGSAQQYGVDPALWAIIEKCVAVRPEERYQSVMELKRELSALTVKPVPLIEPNLKAVVVENFQTAGIGATVAVSKEAEIGATVAVGEEAEIGATVAVGEETDVGATVAVSEEAEIGATVAVSEEAGIGAAVTAEGEPPESSEKRKLFAFFLGKKGIITAAAVLMIAAVIVVLAVTLSKRSDNYIHTGNEGKVVDGQIETVQETKKEPVSEFNTETSGEGMTDPEDLTEGTKDGPTTAVGSTDSSQQTEQQQASASQQQTASQQATEKSQQTTAASQQTTTAQQTTAKSQQTTAAAQQTTAKSQQTTTAAETYVTNKACSVYAGSGSSDSASSLSGYYTGDFKDGKPDGDGYFIKSYTYEDYLYYTIIKGSWSNGYLSGKGSYATGKCFSGKSAPLVTTTDWSKYLEGSYADHESFTIDQGTWSAGVISGECTRYWTTWSKGGSYMLNGEQMTSPDSVSGYYYTTDWIKVNGWLFGSAWDFQLAL